VLELVTTFAEVNGVAVPYAFAGRRPGDIPVSYADVTRAQRVLAWKAERDLAAMCRCAWQWQSSNPSGFAAKIPSDSTTVHPASV
jgi:UDP-glucose 4-epimerase